MGLGLGRTSDRCFCKSDRKLDRRLTSQVLPLAHRLVSSLELLLSSAFVSSSVSVCGVNWSLSRLEFNSLIFRGGVIRSMLVS